MDKEEAGNLISLQPGLVHKPLQYPLRVLCNAATCLTGNIAKKQLIQ